ncbi:MAG: HAMP domain-containing sensor histidine kinase [Planctomycetota bacterium]
MPSNPEPARVRLAVLDEDQTVRAALAALSHTLPLAIAYARPDGAGLDSLKLTQPNVVLLDGGRVKEHLVNLVDALGHLTELSELVLFSEGVELTSTVPGIRVVPRRTSVPELADELRSVLQPAVTRTPGALRFLESLNVMRADHLQWLGSLSAMLAHELNGPVDAAQRFLRLARAAVAQAGDAAGLIDQATQAIDHVARIGRSLLAFERSLSSPQPPRPLGELIGEVIPYARSYAQFPAAIDVDLADPAMLVAPAIFQVLANLLSNSIAAVEGHGRIRITARSAHATLSITVSDNGPGIPPEMQARLFSPFLSTKPYGRGTGLGLPISRQIVQSLGGSLTINSSTSTGTTAAVALPISPRDRGDHAAEDPRL